MHDDRDARVMIPRLILIVALALGLPAHGAMLLNPYAHGVAPPAATTQILLGGSSGVVSLGANRWFPPATVGPTQTTGTIQYFIAPFAFNIVAFKARSLTALSSGSYAVTVQKEGSNTSAACTIDATHQTCTEWTGSVAVSAGEKLLILADPSAGPTPDVSPFVRTSMKIQPTTPNDVVVQGAGNAVFPNSSVTVVVPFAGQTPGSLAAARRTWRAPDNMTCDKFYVFSDPPGAGTSYDFDVVEAGTGTALTLNIADTATDGSDLTHSESVAAGNELNFRGTPNSTPTAAKALFGMRCIPATAGHFVYGATLNSTTDSATVTQYAPPTQGAAFTPATDETTVLSISHAQTVKAMYCGVATAPGAGKDRTFTLRKGQVDTAAVVAISGTATTNQITGLSVAVSDGEELSISDVPTGTPAATQWSCTYLAVVP